MTNSLVERWNRGCDSLPLLQEADQTITQLHAAVKTAQELAATRLMEIERLQSYWLGDKLRGGSDVCHTCHAHCVVIGDKDEEIERLRFAHERIKQRYFESVATMATGALVNELARISADALSGSSEPFEQLDAGKTNLAIAMLDRFRDGRLQTAEGTHTSLLGPRDQLLQEADWFDHAAKVLRSSLR